VQNQIGVIFPIPINKVFDYSVPIELESSIKIGQRVSVPFGPKKETGFVYSITNITNADSARKLKNIISILDKEPLIDEEFLKLAEWMSQYYACSLGEALWAILPKKWNIRNEKLKLITSKNKSDFFKLTQEQKNAVEKILLSCNKNEYKKFLLYGIAGSGKTEIYLNIIKNVLEQGKQAIYLIPEISLTPQIFEILVSRFKDSVALWHSQLTDREKFIIWEKIKRNEIKVLAGPRSAIFAPFKNIGAIIVDEEHEDSYKQDQKPTYDARTVSEWRTKYHNAVLVYGSATPRVETYYRALQDEFEILSLPKKINEYLSEIKSVMTVKVLDMRIELERKNYSMLSEMLRKEIQNRLDKKEQTILFLNRRGFSTYVFCRKCGHVMRCPRCDISLVYHSDKEKLLCHYCGYSIDNPKECPNCKSQYIRYFGGGIQKVESEVRKYFPYARVARLDQDVSKKKGAVEEIYNDVKNKKIDILIGTQIVAKGLDFPSVTLVGVISSDTALNLPDFRASERTFSLLTQVAGRAGRRHLHSDVIFQTYYPNHYSITKASFFDYQSFYNDEIEWRKKLGYPPYKKLVGVTLRGEDDKSVEEQADVLYKKIMDISIQYKLEVSMPFQSTILKKYNNYRWHILIKEDNNTLSYVNREWLNIFSEYKLPKNIRLSVDVDPVDML
jgi:primosomal protein N' (replication factor Y) (superfamily II helicase)